jgi:mannose-1-phosphate guanylyltransferase
MHAVIMAGGSGTRFWPASRTTRPKQFLPLAHGESLIKATVDRVRDLAGVEQTWIVTNPPQAEGMLKLLETFPREQIIIEPAARDTAPCVALAAATIEARDPGATMVVMPADHLIEPEDAFHGMLRKGEKLAADNETLVTFGITPTHPATGFGYIELGNQHPMDSDAWQVLRFREKPDLATAQTFAESGQFLWNSGIFVWNYASLLRAMRIANPELAASTETMLTAARAGDSAAIDAAFTSVPKTSVDYAVMEKADKVAVLRADFTWNDVGSFAALGAIEKPDTYGNVSLSFRSADSLIHQSENCIVYGEGPRTVALFGVSDLVVVQTDDAVLVCPRNRAEELKELIQAMRHAGRTDLL